MSGMNSFVVWDKFIRFFHWSIAILFLLDYWLIEGGEDLHNWIGYAIALLVLLRVVWGFIGTPTARFKSFWPSKASVKQYIQQFPNKTSYTGGHNPLGGMMIIFLLFMLFLTALSGWMRGLDMFWGEGWVQLFHEYSAHVLQASVVIHVVAVLITQKLTGIALIMPMITGKRKIPHSKKNHLL